MTSQIFQRMTKIMSTSDVIVNIDDVITSIIPVLECQPTQVKASVRQFLPDITDYIMGVACF